MRERERVVPLLLHLLHTAILGSPAAALPHMLRSLSLSISLSLRLLIHWRKERRDEMACAVEEKKKQGMRDVQKDKHKMPRHQRGSELVNFRKIENSRSF